MIAAIKKLATARSATADAFALIDELREEGAVIRADIERLQAAPQPVADALAAFDAWAQKVATEGVDAMRPGKLLDARVAPAGLELPVIPTRIGDHMAFDYGATTRTLLGLLIATSMPALRKIVQGQLEDLTLGKETLSPTARAKKLAAAEARLLEVELQEEAAIRALEAAGIAIERRADADPRALLANDDSLPG